MKREVEMALRLLFRFDTSIPPDGRVDLAIEILKGHDVKKPPVVRVKDAADILHVTTKTIGSLMQKGKLARILGKNDRGKGAASTDQRKLAELRRAMDECLKEDMASARPRKR